jgi:hypothetical protein
MMDKKYEIEFINDFFFVLLFHFENATNTNAYNIVLCFCYFHRIVDFDSNLVVDDFFPLLTSFIIGALLGFSFSYLFYFILLHIT